MFKVRMLLASCAAFVESAWSEQVKPTQAIDL